MFIIDVLYLCVRGVVFVLHFWNSFYLCVIPPGPVV